MPLDEINLLASSAMAGKAKGNLEIISKCERRGSCPSRQFYLKKKKGSAF